MLPALSPQKLTRHQHSCPSQGKKFWCLHNTLGLQSCVGGVWGGMKICASINKRHHSPLSSLDEFGKARQQCSTTSISGMFKVHIHIQGTDGHSLRSWPQYLLAPSSRGTHSEPLWNVLTQSVSNQPSEGEEGALKKSEGLQIHEKGLRYAWNKAKGAHRETSNYLMLEPAIIIVIKDNGGNSCSNDQSWIYMSFTNKAGSHFIFEIKQVLLHGPCMVQAYQMCPKAPCIWTTCGFL